MLFDCPADGRMLDVTVQWHEDGGGTVVDWVTAIQPVDPTEPEQSARLKQPKRPARLRRSAEPAVPAAATETLLCWSCREFALPGLTPPRCGIVRVVRQAPQHQ